MPRDKLRLQFIKAFAVPKTIALIRVRQCVIMYYLEDWTSAVIAGSILDLLLSQDKAMQEQSFAGSPGSVSP